jgi:hypothetical protein
MELITKRTEAKNLVLLSTPGGITKIYNCDCRVAIAEQHLSLKGCGIAIAEVLPSSCGIAITDFFKKLRMPTTACTKWGGWRW